MHHYLLDLWSASRKSTASNPGSSDNLQRRKDVPHARAHANTGTVGDGTTTCVERASVEAAKGFDPALVCFRYISLGTPHAVFVDSLVVQVQTSGVGLDGDSFKVKEQRVTRLVIFLNHIDDFLFCLFVWCSIKSKLNALLCS